MEVTSGFGVPGRARWGDREVPLACSGPRPEDPLPASTLLLVVHGRAGGVVPAELQELAAELAWRRRAPVLLEALTGEPPALPVGVAARQLTLVPLMLLPGGHVRHDVPAIAARWRLQLPVRRLPFLGAWPSWQRALAEELTGLVGLVPRSVAQPLLLHHPLEGCLAQRYLALLERRTGASCVPTSYTAPSADVATVPLLPLALAANRLTDSLAAQVGLPLLHRPRFHQLLLAELEALA